MIVNEEDPVKARLVDDRITALLAQANLFIARQIAAEGGSYLELVVNGGEFEVLGQPIEILGLRDRAAILDSLRPAVPPGALRDALDRVIRFATPGPRQPRRRRAADRSPRAADRGREAVGQGSDPAARNLRDRGRGNADADLRHRAAGRRLAGARARGEHLRPPDPRPRLASALLAEKVGLGIVVGLVVTLLMLAACSYSSPSSGTGSASGWWRSSPAAAALAAAGAALGAAARDVRAVSLLAFMVSLPVALLSLVPSGAVGAALFDGIRVVTALFPFKPALQAMTAALDSAGPGIGGPLLHLAILTVAYARSPASPCAASPPSEIGLGVGSVA